MFSIMKTGRNVRKYLKRVGFFAFIMVCLLVLICMNHRPLPSSTTPAVSVQCDDANLLHIEIHNRSTEAMYLSALRFNHGRTIPGRYFQINVNAKTPTNAHLELPLHIQDSSEQPMYNQLQITINTNPNSLSQVPQQLREFPVGFSFKQIEPGGTYVEQADLSAYIGEARSRGSVAFSYTLTICYSMQRDLDKPPLPNEPTAFDRIADKCSRLLEIFHIRLADEKPFGPVDRKIELVDVLHLKETASGGNRKSR